MAFSFDYWSIIKLFVIVLLTSSSSFMLLATYIVYNMKEEPCEAILLPISIGYNTLLVCLRTSDLLECGHLHDRSRSNLVRLSIPT